MNDDETFCRLTQILADDGVGGLEFFCLDDFKGIRGLSSLLSRQPGEELFRIPLKYLFTDYNIEKHPKLSEIWTKYPKLLAEFQQNSNCQNAVYPFILLFYYEVINPSTEFNRIWFSLFPRDLNGHTIAWSDAELKGCGNLCPIRRDTIEIQVWIKKTFKILQPIIEEFKDTIFGEEGVKQFTESMVEFLCMTCRNRGVLLPITDTMDSVTDDEKELKGNNDNNTEQTQIAGTDKLYHCFVPLGDFGNHKFGAKSSIQLEYMNKRRHLHDANVNMFVKSHPELMKKKFFEYDDKSKCLVVRAQEQILSGGQICYEYTAAPNWELLLNFGFAVPFNPYDRVIVNITFDNEDPKRLSKELQLLNKMGVSSFIKRMEDGSGDEKKYKYSLAIALTLSDACPTVLLSANRIKLLSDQQLNELTPREIAFMDRVILKNKNNKKKGGQQDDTNDEVKDDIRDVNKLKILELNVLRSLQASLDVLWQGYQKDSLIDPNQCNHPDVNVVYQSIRMILRKSMQILEQKIKDLGHE